MSEVKFFGRNCDPPDAVSLYIHLPFCNGKCHYCDFYSIDIRREVRDRIDLILTEIIAQLEYMVSTLSTPLIRTLYIGGGTPTVLPAVRFESFLKDITAACGVLPMEITVEANPESITPEHLAVFSTIGVTRLSVGVQTFHSKGLEILGRRCSEEQLAKPLEYIRNTWSGDLNIDLMCGIPEIEPEVAYGDCRRVMDEYDPEHISLYTLTVEEDTPLYRLVHDGTVSPLDDSLVSDVWLQCVYILREQYRHYEISNFAKPGHVSEHNLGYWQMKPYIGCGPSAVSNLPSGEGFLRIQNPADISNYLHGRTQFWSAEVEEIERSDSVFEYFMMGLRTVFGVDLVRFSNTFGRSTLVHLFDIFHMWQEKELACVDEHTVTLTDRGRGILDHLLLELLEVIEDEHICSSDSVSTDS